MHEINLATHLTCVLVLVFVSGLAAGRCRPAAPPPRWTPVSAGWLDSLTSVICRHRLQGVSSHFIIYVKLSPAGLQPAGRPPFCLLLLFSFLVWVDTIFMPPRLCSAAAGRAGAGLIG